MSKHSTQPCPRSPPRSTMAINCKRFQSIMMGSIVPISIMASRTELLLLLLLIIFHLFFPLGWMHVLTSLTMKWSTQQKKSYLKTKKKKNDNIQSLMEKSIHPSLLSLPYLTYQFYHRPSHLPIVFVTRSTKNFFGQCTFYKLNNHYVK